MFGVQVTIVNYSPFSDTILDRVGESIISFVFITYIFGCSLCDCGFSLS